MLQYIKYEGNNSPVVCGTNIFRMTNVTSVYVHEGYTSTDFCEMNVEVNSFPNEVLL